MVKDPSHHHHHRDTPPRATPKILVVDDNAQNLALAKETLEDEGYEVVLATRGEDALRLFEKERPDCVLLDIRMPGLDGTATCSLLRAMPGGADVPVVFLTALRDVETFDKAMAAGGDDFLTKPVKPGELVVRVQSALKVRRLSHELREQYEVVRHQRDALLRLQLQKERLTSFVVHDLKNPVNSMDLHAQLLLRNKELPASSRDSVLRIRDEARALLRLILNLLDISKAEEEQLSPSLADVDLHALLAAVMDAFAVKAKDGHVELASALEVASVRADPDLLRRVLENLIDNALRHAPKDTVVTIAAAPVGGRVQIRVRDAGKGVPEDMRERVFERFVQVDAEKQGMTRAGRGLGLSFCKVAVEAHGGHIWFEDGNPGAIFCVELGAPTPPAPPSSAGHEGKAHGAHETR